MQEKIETIKQACIKANPEIMELKMGCVVNSKTGDEFYDSEEYKDRICLAVGLYPKDSWYGKSGQENLRISDSVILRHFEILGRPIRLADVLLAIANIDARLKLNRGANIIRIFGSETMLEWNLLKDSLTDQSLETIDFIYNLLK